MANVKKEHRTGIVASMRQQETLANMPRIAEDAFIPSPGFDTDLCNEMIKVGHGFDPYNHIGDDVVACIIGVS